MSEKPFLAGTAGRLLRELEVQGSEPLSGHQITRLSHGLQAATRARREGADTDWIVAALLHDIGDGFAPQNHDKFAAEIMRPFMREEVVWTVEHHGVFQMHYYAHESGWDPKLREKYAGHPYFQSCIDFCDRWDRASLDPDYPCDPLESFQDEVGTVFARRAWDPRVLKKGVVTGLPDLGFSAAAE